MHHSRRFLFFDRHIIYELKGGFLVTPTLLMVGLGVIGASLSEIESLSPTVQLWAKGLSWIAVEPSVAQLLLGAIAGSSMTIVAVVYSMLLMALTFASVQFSPRIIVTFVRDSVSQITLGMFLGTFVYCLVVLPRVRAESPEFVPTFAVTLALLLAVTCLAYLMYFIHHIALAIQANHIIDRIAKDTDEVFVTICGSSLRGEPKEEVVEPPSDGYVLWSMSGGYIQYIEDDHLVDEAIKHDASIFIHRGIGQFIPPHMPLITISPATAATDNLKKVCLRGVHIGPVRTLEDDPEFGVMQIVDIGLKALSAAVNDPSTAIACIDQLSSLLVRAATFELPASHVYDDRGIIRLTRKQATFPRILDIAFNQIIPYGKTDMAVSLRIMRALADIASVTESRLYLAAIRKMARRVESGCKALHNEADCSELFDRLALIERHTSEVEMGYTQTNLSRLLGNAAPINVVEPVTAADLEAIGLGPVSANDKAPLLSERPSLPADKTSPSSDNSADSVIFDGDGTNAFLVEG